MLIDLTDTTTAEVRGALTRARDQLGGPTTGVVLNLIIMTDESRQHDAVRAANQAGREHPCRILGVISRGSSGSSRLDAEIRSGDGAAGQTVLLRLYGPMSLHPDSVVMPLLVPDTPVVTWWPGNGPDVPSGEPLGALAQRRVTDAASADHPAEALHGGTVSAEEGNPTADLLTAWLASRLHAPFSRGVSGGPGITGVSFAVDDGEITITRPDGRTATLSRPGQPDRHVALQRRDTAELLAEELRRLNPDEVYGETLAAACAAVPADRR